MSEVRDWLISIGIPGIERLSEEFESRGFTTKKSLQYLKQGDLDYIFSSPKRLLLAEKRALDCEIRRLQEGSLQPRQLTYHSATVSNVERQYQMSNVQQGIAISIPTAAPQEQASSPLDRRRHELEENVSLLEVQISSAEEYLAKLRQENDSLETVTRGRICSRCHLAGHNKNSCRGMPCDSHRKCRLKDKHPELSKTISDTQKNLKLLRKNKESAKNTLEQFVMQIQRSRGNFFSIMRPRLKALNPIKYINRQELDKDLLYLRRALENKVPPESEDWRLLQILEAKKGEIAPQPGAHVNLASAVPSSSISSMGSSSSTGSSNTSEIPTPSGRFHPYFNSTH